MYINISNPIAPQTPSPTNMELFSSRLDKQVQEI